MNPIRIHFVMAVVAALGFFTSAASAQGPPRPGQQGPAGNCRQQSPGQQQMNGQRMPPMPQYSQMQAGQSQTNLGGRMPDLGTTNMSLARAQAQAYTAMMVAQAQNQVARDVLIARLQAQSQMGAAGKGNVQQLVGQGQR